MAARKKSSASRKSASKKSASARSRSSSTRRTPDALALLRADHQKVDQLLQQFEKARGSDRKESLAETICRELTVHAQLEEEIFYPAAREALRSDQDLLDEATVEHASAKDLIAQIEGMDAGDELFEAKVTVLGEYVKHHVKEEQNELFPKVRKAKLDLKALGERMEARKLELQEGGAAGAGRSAGGGGTRRTASGTAGSRRGERATAKATKGREDEGILATMARGMGFSGR
ncbi:MAG TPA: hemerythrin domain-containing protein [Burkholderiales bacterium]|nr:hemerythrin domain-containing protein [Burkholderiales bacterium]